MSHLPKLSPRRIARVDEGLALKAARVGASRSRPPGYGYGLGTYLPGEGFGPNGNLSRDYLRDAGRIDLNPLVRLILDWYANAWTQAMLRVGRKVKKGERKGEYEVNTTHDLNRIFRRPCPVFSARETGAMFIGGLLIDGNAYGVIVEDNGGRPAEVWWVPNWQVEVIAGDGTDPRRPIRAYRIHDLNGGWREYSPEFILHIRDLPDPRNPLIGYGRLKCFLPYLVAVESGGEYTNEALRKGNTGIVLMPPENASGTYSYGPAEESEMRGHADRLRRGLARGGNTPVMFLTSYLVHDKIGLSPREMEASTILDRPESYVLAAGGLSSMVLNLPSAMSGQTFANKAEASRAAWEDSAVPMFTLIAEAWQDQVLYRRDPDTGEEEGRFGDAPGLEVWADTSEVPALAENLQEKADLWIALSDAGYVKPKWAAKTHFDIPEEAIPEDEPAGEEFDPEGGEGEGEGEGEDEGEDDDDPFDDEDEDADAPASATKARRSRSKGGKPARQVKPECSRAMSAIGRGVGSPADFAQAGRCRAARNSEKRSERDRQQGEGYSQRARATDRFAREMSTRKERVARVKAVLAKVRAANAARQQAGATPKTPKARRPRREEAPAYEPPAHLRAPDPATLHADIRARFPRYDSDVAELRSALRHSAAERGRLMMLEAQARNLIVTEPRKHPANRSVAVVERLEAETRRWEAVGDEAARVERQLALDYVRKNARRAVERNDPHGSPEIHTFDAVPAGRWEVRFPRGQDERAAMQVRMVIGREFPDRLTESTRRVYLVDGRNTQDAYWAEKYGEPGFRSSATGGDGDIVVYNGETAIPSTLAHEAGHNLATRLYGGINPGPTSAYRAAMDSGEPPVSNYARKSPAEDFAEAANWYVIDPTRMQREFPRRFNVIDRIMRESTYGG